MRKRFKTENLKVVFGTAWEAIPLDVSKALCQFIRQVREVDNLAGTYIRCPDGTRHGPLNFGTGYTFFYKDSDFTFCDIILPSLLNDASRAEAITIMLHELSHAWEYYQLHEDAIDEDDLDSEIRAWKQAVEWAKLGIRDVDLVLEITFAAFEAEFLPRLLDYFERKLDQIK